MKHEPQFYFNPEDGSSLCVLSTKNKTYVGTAQCLDSDRDMMNEKTGCEIAYHRATIHALEDHLNDLQGELAGLKKYFYTVNQSKYYDANDYMAQMLIRQIQQRTDDILITKNMIAEEKEYLKNYMKDKAEFYKKIRYNREAERQLAKNK